MKKNPKNIAVFTLLAFLFSGLGTTIIFPVLITSLAHSHPIFITEGNGKINLVIHHPGNHDEHEARKNIDHRHDLLDLTIGIPKDNDAPHSDTDHEVEFPSIEEKISTTIKSTIDSNAFSFLAISDVLPVYIKREVGNYSLHFSSVLNPLDKSLRTPILRI